MHKYSISKDQMVFLDETSIACDFGCSGYTLVKKGTPAITVSIVNPKETRTLAVIWNMSWVYFILLTNQGYKKKKADSGSLSMAFG